MIILINNDQFSIIKIERLISNICKKIFKSTFKLYVLVNINGVSDIISKDLLNSSYIDLIKKNNIKALNVIRHSCAHLMAHALCNIYTDVKLSVGPVITNGFYYDFFIDKKISFHDLKKIEEKMLNLSNKNIEIKKINITKDHAENIFFHNKYKADIIKNVNKDKKLSIYIQSNFTDLCKGPHVPHTGFLKYFKLIKVSGAYWKNNQTNEMLTRIYGTAWYSKNDLYTYITTLNKLKTSDHRIIGKKLQLFNFYNHSPGVVFWNKNGWQIFIQIKNFIRCLMKELNYKEVNTPIMLGNELFKKSGHIEKFIDNMFIYSNDTNINVLKPMSCPCHISIFNNFYKKSYRNLPFRLSEFGSCFRNELSGALHGLMRLKNFTQDDGHIFCTYYQLKTEIIKFIHSLKKIYYKFGFSAFKIILSKKPINIVNDLHTWFEAEKILEETIKNLDLEYSISNDGAFYGPKIEFLLRDKFNRLWQCGTIQVDFFTSVKLNAKYINQKGMQVSPIILHRAIFGSIERFIGVLLENNSGSLPFWIVPIQFKIVYISNKYLFYAKNIYNIIKKKYNVDIYFGNERLEYKIKQCILQKIPYIIILGEKEYNGKYISIRSSKDNKIFKKDIKDFLFLFSFTKKKGELY